MYIHGMQQLLLEHLKNANWKGVQEELDRLVDDTEDELLRSEAVAVVCRHNYCQEVGIDPAARVVLLDKIAPDLAACGGVVGDMALTGAVQGNDPLLLDALLARGVRPVPGVPRPRHELGPVLYAMGLGRVDMLKSLLAHGADLEEADVEGCSGLCYAAAGNHHEMLRFLVAHGLKPNRQDARGRTALMSELFEMTPATVDVLLDLGASLRMADNEGTSVAQHAQASDKPAGKYLAAVLQAHAISRLTRPGAAPMPPRRRF